jgi:hypothetical protein
MTLNKTVYSTSTRSATMRKTRVTGLHRVAAAPRWFCLRGACPGLPSEDAEHNDDKCGEYGPEYGEGD